MGEAPVQDSMVGGPKRSRTNGITHPRTKGIINIPHGADGKSTSGRDCKPITGGSINTPRGTNEKRTNGQDCKPAVQPGKIPVQVPLVGGFKRPRKYRITSPVNGGGGGGNSQTPPAQTTT